MKISFLTLSFLIFSTELAEAQMYSCMRPRKPFLPLGYGSTYDQMKMAQDDYKRYIDKMKDYIDCIDNESNDALSEAKRVIREWEYTVDSFSRK